MRNGWVASALLALAAIVELALVPMRWARAPGAGALQALVGLLLLLGAVLAWRSEKARGAHGALVAASLGAAYWVATHVLRSPFEEAPRRIPSVELVVLLASLAAATLLARRLWLAHEDARWAALDVGMPIAAGIFLVGGAYAVALVAEPLAPDLSVGYHDQYAIYPPGVPLRPYSPLLNQSESWSFTFPPYVGRYYYHCMPHDDLMGGTIFVTDAPDAPAALDVTIRDYAFDPPDPVIRAGGTITWTNVGREQHDIMLLTYDLPEKRGIPGPGLLAVACVVGLACLAAKRR